MFDSETVARASLLPYLSHALLLELAGCSVHRGVSFAVWRAGFRFLDLSVFRYRPLRYGSFGSGGFDIPYEALSDCAAGFGLNFLHVLAAEHSSFRRRLLSELHRPQTVIPDCLSSFAAHSTPDVDALHISLSCVDSSHVPEQGHLPRLPRSLDGRVGLSAVASSFRLLRRSNLRPAPFPYRLGERRFIRHLLAGPSVPAACRLSVNTPLYATWPGETLPPVSHPLSPFAPLVSIACVLPAISPLILLPYPCKHPSS